MLALQGGRRLGCFLRVGLGLVRGDRCDLGFLGGIVAGGNDVALDDTVRWYGDRRNRLLSELEFELCLAFGGRAPAAAVKKRIRLRGALHWFKTRVLVLKLELGALGEKLFEQRLDLGLGQLAVDRLHRVLKEIVPKFRAHATN